MADEQQSISDDLIDELVTTAVGNIRPVHVYPEWQSAETAPKDGTKILGRNNRGNMTVVLWQEWGGRGGWVCMFSDASHHPFWNGGCGSVMTHWMPLPKQPR